MSDRRRKYAECAKVRFDTKELADQALEKIKQDTSTEHKPRRSYKCEVCGSYHLTSISRNQFRINERHRKIREMRNSVKTKIKPVKMNPGKRVKKFKYDRDV